MRIGCNPAWAAWLLLATLALGCAAAKASERDEQPQSSGASVVVGDTAMSPEEFRDLKAQPAADQRRRLDLVLASHPDAIGARFLRLKAEDRLADFAAVIEDSDLLLASPSLDRRLRPQVLDPRAEALIQAHRLAEAVAASTEALESDGLDAAALFARAWARYLGDRTQADNALADLNRALQIEPDEGIAYFRRSVIFQDQGKFDLAASDLDRALQLAPDDVPSRQQIASLLFAAWYSGQPRESVDFFRELAARPDANPYAPVWLFLMRVEANPTDEATAKGELTALAPEHEPPEWTDTLVKLMLGKVSLESALTQADAAPTYQLKAGRRCEADYYAAQQLLLHGQDVPATRLLEEAYWVCPSTYAEARAVDAARRRLEARSPAR